MNSKTYEAAGQFFRLKDLTLDEADEVNNLIQVSGDTIEIKNESSKKFLSIVLEQCPSPCLPAGKATTSLKEDESGIDFGKMKESTALEVLKDFFTVRIGTQQKLIEFFAALAIKQNV